MMILQLQLVLLLPLVIAFGPRAVPHTTRNHRRPEHLQHITTEHSYLFTSSARQVSVSTTQEPASPKQQAKTQRVENANDSGIINNRHSANDWLYNLQTIPKSSVLREIKHPVLTLTGWATLVGVLHKMLLWSGRSNFASNLCIPPAAHGFLVSSLGLLLVFRTNSAYQRFLEGRKIWEEILTVSRNLSRMMTLYRPEVGNERLDRMKYLIATFPYLLKHHIRSGCLCKNHEDVDDQFKIVLQEPYTQIVDSRYEGDKVSGGAFRPIMDVEEQQSRQCVVDRRDLPWRLLDNQQQSDDSTLLQVAQAMNRPLWVCDRLGREVMGIPYTHTFTSRERLSLLGNIDKLTNAIGKCERIHQTAVPLNYARHALRSLTLWLVTLPFCLVQDFGLLTGPMTGIVAWLLFGVYQIGHSIEDPFQGSLRLTVLCDAIRRDVLTDPNHDTRGSAFSFDEEEDELDFFPTINVKDTKKEVEDFVMFEQTPKPDLNKLILESAAHLLRKKNDTVKIRSWEP